MEMGDKVKWIQADMTKLSKSHSYTSNIVSKLLDKSRKLSVTMKEVGHRTELVICHQTLALGHISAFCLGFRCVRRWSVRDNK